MLSCALLCFRIVLDYVWGMLLHCVMLSCVTFLWFILCHLKARYVTVLLCGIAQSLQLIRIEANDRGFGVSMFDACVYASICQYMPAYIIIYHYIPVYTIISQYMSANIIICHYIQVYTILSQYVSSYIIMCHYIPVYVIIYHYVSLYTSAPVCVGKCQYILVTLNWKEHRLQCGFRRRLASLILLCNAVVTQSMLNHIR